MPEPAAGARTVVYAQPELLPDLGSKPLSLCLEAPPHQWSPTFGCRPAPLGKSHGSLENVPDRFSRGGVQIPVGTEKAGHRLTRRRGGSGPLGSQMAHEVLRGQSNPVHQGSKAVDIRPVALSQPAER